MNLALYRKFRPTTFNSVIGQNHITRTLSNQVKSGDLTHAYLFTGTRGTGKTSCAKIFSKAINCLTPIDGSPCGKCSVCEALDLPNTDVLEIDAASNNRVDEIRELRERVKYPPTIARKKVYIIDEVHMLTESAFNALLKTLEEPPEYVVFILATTEVHKLPATILSRCTRFDFRLLTTEELVNHLKYVFNKQGITCDGNSLYLIATQGAGSVHDTLSIADSVSAFCENNITYDKCLEVLGLTSNQGISKLVDNIIDNNIQGIFTEVKTILNRGKNITMLCKETTEYFKNLLLIQSGVSDLNVLNVMPNELELMTMQANKISNSIAKLAFDRFARIELDLKYSANPQNLFEAICVNLLDVQARKEVRVENINNSSVQQSNLNINISNNIEKKSIDSNNNVNDTNISNSKVTVNNDIDRLWGSVLLEIKKRNMFALSSSLRDVYGVHMAGNCLILKTNDQSVLKSIDEPSRLDVILSIATTFNADIKKVEIEYDKTNKSSKDVVAELKNIFMDKLKVKE